jgi:hypothetical protein
MSASKNVVAAATVVGCARVVTRRVAATATCASFAAAALATALATALVVLAHDRDERHWRLADRA